MYFCKILSTKGDFQKRSTIIWVDPHLNFYTSENECSIWKYSFRELHEFSNNISRQLGSSRKWNCSDIKDSLLAVFSKKRDRKEWLCLFKCLTSCTEHRNTQYYPKLWTKQKLLTVPIVHRVCRALFQHNAPPTTFVSARSRGCFYLSEDGATVIRPVHPPAGMGEAPVQMITNVESMKS